VVGVGKRKRWRAFYEDLEENIKSRIKIIDYIQEEDLPALYNLAKIFVWPSFYEGFGLPVLEALACACPVITANNSSLPSVVKDQALLIEAFDEVAGDKESVEKMKIWLLKQKQTQDWKTTKATAEAIYALMLRGTDLLASDELVDITIGKEKIDPKNIDGVNVEAGTGYFWTSWTGNEIKPDMGNITVTKNDEGVAWGAVYWQYFEGLDKITTHKTPLSLEKKLFVEKNTPGGPVN